MLPGQETHDRAGCCPDLLRILYVAIMGSDRQPGIRESDPEAMLGLVILVMVGLLVAMAVGVTLGLLVG